MRAFISVLIAFVSGAVGPVWAQRGQAAGAGVLDGTNSIEGVLRVVRKKPSR